MHINTHEAYKQLVDAGLKEKVAETIIKVINESRTSDISTLSTKEDAHNLELKIAEIDLKIADLKGDFKTLRWMMGFLLVMCSGILLKLLFGD